MVKRSIIREESKAINNGKLIYINNEDSSQFTIVMKIIKYCNYFRKDYIGTLFYIITLIKRDLISFVYTPIIYYLRLKGCKISSSSKFYGKPIVERFPNSKIEIGKSCEFVSTSLVNYRGISHKCILNTGCEGAEIIIGDNCGFSGVSIVSDNLVKIGNNVTVGADTLIGDRDDHTELYASKAKPVIIDRNVWIGMHCIVLKGVHIGENTIIGAGSIVTKDIPANSIAAGIPCKVIKKR